MKLIAINTKNDGIRGFCAVSDEDFDRINQHKWYMNHFGYACRNVNKRALLMHRDVMGAGKGEEVDHINMDKLDNRRENLRFCTRADNMRNIGKRAGGSSRYKGVYYVPRKRWWIALVGIGKGKQKHIGVFKNEQDAALAYDKHARIIHGDFARLNFPVDGERGALS